MRTLSELSRFLVEYPRTLPVWKELGEDRSLLALLAEAELASAQGVREASSEEELWPVGRAWQDAIGVLIRWWTDPHRPRHRRDSYEAIAKALSATYNGVTEERSRALR